MATKMKNITIIRDGDGAEVIPVSQSEFQTLRRDLTALMQHIVEIRERLDKLEKK